MSFYKFREFEIADHMGEAINRYIRDGIEPGGFLTAVIENNLRDACAYADETNLRNLPAFVSYFYNEAPSFCWGSRDNMKTWCADRKKIPWVQPITLKIVK